jgi:hypothetical protein
MQKSVKCNNKNAFWQKTRNNDTKVWLSVLYYYYFTYFLDSKVVVVVVRFVVNMYEWCTLCP